MSEQRATGSDVQTARAAPRAKRLLQGRPLGHPLHPMLVHLPIGLWFLSFALDVIALTRDAGAANGFVRAAYYTLVAGIVFAVLAIITGFADYADVRRDHPARKTANWHMALNLAASGIFLSGALLRTPRLDDADPWIVPVVLSGIGVVLVGISGYLGGVMVYDDGLAVGRHRRSHEPPGETVKVSGPADAGYVDVMNAEDLPRDAPTRVDVNGHVVVLLRRGSQVYAFQEFCTHRFGPLSEGKLDDEGNIMCPWHRSCFDVKTGKVTNGPAKVDLKTYSVREEAGRVSVRVSDG